MKFAFGVADRLGDFQAARATGYGELTRLMYDLYEGSSSPWKLGSPNRFKAWLLVNTFGPKSVGKSAGLSPDYELSISHLSQNYIGRSADLGFQMLFHMLKMEMTGLATLYPLPLAGQSVVMRYLDSSGQAQMV